MSPPLLSSSSDEDQMYLEPEPHRPAGLHLQPRAVPYFRRHTLPVSKWSVKFTGDSSGLKLSDFLNQIDIMATAEDATNEELLRSAIYLFDGFAKTYIYGQQNQICNVGWVSCSFVCSVPTQGLGLLVT